MCLEKYDIFVAFIMQSRSMILHIIKSITQLLLENSEGNLI